jgi:nitrite reductase/ring-hydroxylating ferredoxin subunit
MDLPPDAYTQGDPFQREKATLFAREWLPFCATGQLAETGSFVNHTLGGWPLFAVRGADGAARAFRNSCRHQRMPVVDKPTGHCAELRCRFHGWTYDLSGAFVAAPPPVAPADPGADRHRLESIALAERGALVLVRVEPDAASDPPTPDLAGLAYAAAVTIDVDSNWKAVVETLLAEAGGDYCWPLAFIRDSAGARIVRQIVPRSFARTRIVDLLFGPPGADAANALEPVRAEAERTKRDAEAWQARLAAGAGASGPETVSQFRGRVVASCR